MLKLTIRLVLVVALLGGLPVFADLAPIAPVTNTPLLFDALLHWTSVGSSNTYVTTIGTPWTVTISGDVGSGIAVSLTAHQVGPHGESTSGPGLSAFVFGVTPGSGSGFASDSGLHDGPHYDLLTLSVAPVDDALLCPPVCIGDSLVHVRAVHVPEPSTVDLRAGWLAGLALLLVRRKKAPIAA